MPASTDNPNILASANQIIQALLDMISQGFPITIPEGAIQVNVTNNITGASSGCGGCSGGTGSIIDSEPVDGQPDEAGSGPGGYPPPASWDDEGGSNPFDEYKCKAANFIYDSIALTLDYIGGLSTVAGAIEAGAALGAWLVASVAAWSPIGVVGVSIFAVLTGWEIALIMGLIATASLVVGVPVLLAFNYARTELANHKQAFVCALYNARDLPAAKTAAADVLTDVVTLFDIGELSAWDATVRQLVQDVIDYWLPNTLLNKLFEEDATIRDTYAPGDPVDCVVCGGDPLMYVYALYCEATIVDGDLSEGVETELTSCNGGFFSTANRAGVALASTEINVNRHIEVIECSPGTTTFYVLAQNGAVPLDLGELNQAGVEALEGDWSAIQITRRNAGQTDPFTLKVIIT